MAIGFFQGLFSPRRAQVATPASAPEPSEHRAQPTRNAPDTDLQEALGKPGHGDATLGYRRLTRSDDRRDMDPVKWDWHARLSNWLWATHPVAKKCLQNHKNFICGTGFRVQSLCPDETKRNALQALYDQHWSINEWDRELSRRVESLSVESEWVYYCPPSEPQTGHFQMAKILCEQVKEIERDPVNGERLRYVHLVEPVSVDDGGMVTQLTKLEIAHREWRSWEEQGARRTGIRGDTLYLGINRLSGQTRGFSDLLAVADHLDVFDNMLFTEVERVGIQRAFVWDVAVTPGKGGDPKAPGREGDQVKRRRQELTKAGPPRPGTVNVHDSSEEWKCVNPQLGMYESVAFMRFILSLCLGGMHNPEHWFAEGGDTNRATSDNQQGPAFAHIRERKREIIDFMTLALELQQQRWMEAGMLAGLGELTAEDLRFQIVSRDPEQTAYQAVGAILQALGQGLQIGQSQGWFSAVEAARAYREAASHLGLGDFPGVPPSETLDQAKAVVKSAMDQLQHQQSEQAQPQEAK